MINFTSKNKIFIICILLPISLAFSLSVGSSSLSLKRILPIILGNGSIKENFIFFHIRIPRTLIVAFSGMALSLSGALLQNITKNDLADPGIIGINSGAGLSITLLYLFFPTDIILFPYLLPFVGLLGAVSVALLIYKLSSEKNKGVNLIKMTLTGIVVSSALSSLMIILISSADRLKVEFISKWLSGNIWGTDWFFVIYLIVLLTILFFAVFFKINKLNIINLGEISSINLGINLKKERMQIFFIATALASVTVSITGAISFIGLIGPHMAKNLIGIKAKSYIPVSIILGALIMSFADTLGRYIFLPHILPTGIVVALVGAPYFIFLLLKKNY